MMIYGMVFFPIFACLAIGSVFGYGISALYVWAITAVNIYKTFACDVSTVSKFRSAKLVLTAVSRASVS